MGKKANAGRFERGYLKVTIENLTSWTLSGREKPPKPIFRGALHCPAGQKKIRTGRFLRVRHGSVSEDSAGNGYLVFTGVLNFGPK